MIPTRLGLSLDNGRLTVMALTGRGRLENAPPQPRPPGLAKPLRRRERRSNDD